MIHTKYDFVGAIESARKALNRTGRARWVILTAIGYQIASKRPRNPIYGAFKVTKRGYVYVA